MQLAVVTRVPRTGGNRAGSRSYQSGPVWKMTGTWSLPHLKNQAKPWSPIYRAVCSVFRPVFWGSANRTGFGLGNPGSDWSPKPSWDLRCMWSACMWIVGLSFGYNHKRKSVGCVCDVLDSYSHISMPAGTNAGVSFMHLECHQHETRL
jgi:hypothetical protein